MNPITDQEILELFGKEKTKEQGFNLLVKKYKQEIYYSIRHLVFSHEDANDISQNVLIKIWRHLDQFRGDAGLKTWIKKICVNESLTFLERKKKMLNIIDEEGYNDYVTKTVAEVRFLSSDKIQQLLEQAIQLLPEKQRAVFTLRYYDEMSYEEMTQIFGGTEGGLKASYHFAVQKVEEFLSKH